MAVDYTAAGSICGKPMDYVLEVGGNVFTYDARIFDYDFAPLETPYLTYLSNTTNFYDTLYQSIHVNGSTKVPIFESASERVSDAYAFE
jgi:hypothetical protein